MSQIGNQPIHRHISGRTAALVILLIGSGVALTLYSLDNAFGATTNPTNISSLTGNTTVPWPAPAWHRFHEGTGLGFRAVSTVNNVTVTGFQIVDSNHITITLNYGATGTSPAITVVGIAPGLSGSTTLSAGWGSPKTLSLHLIGAGTLSTSGPNAIRVAVLPLTGS